MHLKHIATAHAARRAAPGALAGGQMRPPCASAGKGSACSGGGARAAMRACPGRGLEDRRPPVPCVEGVLIRAAACVRASDDRSGWESGSTGHSPRARPRARAAGGAGRDVGDGCAPPGDLRRAMAAAEDPARRLRVP